MDRNEKEIEHYGSCHCQKVQYKIITPKEIKLIYCNCSICVIEDYKHLIIDKIKFELITGKNNVTTYSFNTHNAKHYFCKHCGIKSFYIPRSHPNSISINFRCIKNNKLKIKKIIKFKGKNWEKNINKIKKKTIK